MEYGNKRLNKKQKKSVLKTFLVAAGITLAACAVIIIAGFIIYNNTVGAQSVSQVKNELTKEEKVFEEEKKEVSELNKTIAVFGVDEDEIRTDVIFVVNFNTATDKVKVVSIPRDTKVIWTDKQKRAYSQLTGHTQNISKLNEMAAYGRINQNVGNIRDFTIDEMENILRVHIDSYVVINLEAFKEIVDAIGGVDMYVPQNMYYRDRSQGLYIDLKEGMQHLDRDTAEQLVRFRRYPLGDEARVQVQQTFLTAVAQKVMSPETRKNLPSVVTRLFPYIKTDIKLNEVLDYLSLLDQFDLSNLKMYTVPGYGDSKEGPSYYYIDQDKLDGFLKDVFFDTEVATDSTESATPESAATDKIEIDKTVSIAVYNATGKKGIAGSYKDKLEDYGYDVKKIDNYEKGNAQDSTIYAKDKTKGQQFKQYITGADVVEDSTLEYDIKIVIGNESLE